MMFAMITMIHVLRMYSDDLYCLFCECYVCAGFYIYIYKYLYITMQTLLCVGVWYSALVVNIEFNYYFATSHLII